MPPEVAEVRRWLLKAQHDWVAAQQLFAGGAAVLDVVAFHCQQAIEKSLKAYLVSQEFDFEKTHDLRKLVKCCIGFDDGFQSVQDSVEPITSYAVAFRYPGPSEPSRTQIEQALLLVEHVWDLVAQRVPAEAVPDKPAR